MLKEYDELINNQFEWDLRTEEYIRELYTLPFFWNKFYPHQIKVAHGEDNKAGADIYCRNVPIDEKCSTGVWVDTEEEPYTWAVEICSSWETRGWFVDQNKSAEEYLFVQIRKYNGPMIKETKYKKDGSPYEKKTPIKTIPPIHFALYIEQLFCFMESREELENKIRELTGYTPDMLFNKGKELKTCNKRDYIGDKIYLLRTPVGKQYPVNLVIPFSVHKELMGVNKIINVKEMLECQMRKNSLVM